MQVKPSLIWKTKKQHTCKSKRLQQPIDIEQCMYLQDKPNSVAVRECREETVRDGPRRAEDWNPSDWFNCVFVHLCRCVCKTKRQLHSVRIENDQNCMVEEKKWQITLKPILALHLWKQYKEIQIIMVFMLASKDKFVPDCCY